MKHANPLRVLSSLLLLFISTAATAQDHKAEDKPDSKSYEIKFARPLKVGQKYSMTADGALTRETTIKRGAITQKQPEDGFGVRLEGTVEVLALDEIGEESKVSIAVTKCTRITSEGETVLVEPGKVLLAEGKGKDTKFAIEGGAELPKDAAEVLDLVVSLDTDDKLTDDDLLGTREKKKVGDAWQATSENVAKDYERVGVVVKPGDVEGSFRIDGVEKKGDVECLKLSGNLKVKNLVSKADDNEDDGLPEGFVVEGGSMEAKFSGLFPVDTAVGSLAESASMTFVTHVKGKGGGGDDDVVTVETRVQRAVTMERKFLGP